MMGFPTSTKTEKIRAAPIWSSAVGTRERAEFDEEEHEHEVAQRRQAPTDRIAVGRRREREPGEERADLLAESQQDRYRRQRDRPRHGPEDEQLRLARQQGDEARRDVATEQDDQSDEDHAAGDHVQDLDAQRPRCVTAGGDSDHGEDHSDVLDDQETDRDAPVQVVDLALVREQLHDDDRRGEGQGDRDVERRHGREAERASDDVTDDGREHDLPDTGGECDRTEAPDEAHVELQSDDEEQQRDAELREQLDL